jgi:hypothetical protein
MRTFVLALSFLAAISLLHADEITAGIYKGKWEGASASGDFQVTLSRESGNWSGNVAFALGGQDIKCKVTSVKVDGSKLEMTYRFDLQGTPLESTIEGDLSGKHFTGKYKTKSIGDGSAVDEGTWSAIREG